MEVFSPARNMYLLSTRPVPPGLTSLLLHHSPAVGDFRRMKAPLLEFLDDIVFANGSIDGPRCWIFSRVELSPPTARVQSS